MTLGSSATSPAGGGVRVVRNTVQLLEELAAQQPVGVTELARSVGLPKSSVHRLLKTLEACGWVESGMDGPPRWRLTHKVFRVGSVAAGGHTLREAASHGMASLNRTYGETVHLSVLDGRHVTVVAKVEGTNDLRTFLPLGSPAPMTRSAAGRVILANLSPEAVEGYLADEAEGEDGGDCEAADHVRREIEFARRRGYALNRGEWRNGIGAIAAPIMTSRGGVEAVISLSMPVGRLHELDLEEVGSRLKGVCQDIGNQIQNRL